jgi:glycosyltransferase involved in cell wall biosynthesis
MAAAERNDVWLVTSNRHAEKIEVELARSRPTGLQEVRYLEDEVGALPDWRLLSNSQVRYLRWQRAARKPLRRLHDQIGFDLGHHLTWGVDWQPAAVAAIPGLPYVWGPVGGAAPVAVHMARWLGARGVASELGRDLVSRPARRLVGRHTARGAALVLAQNTDVERAFTGLAPLVVAPHTAIAADLPTKAASNTSTGAHATGKGVKTALYVGRLLPWKGIRLAVAAMVHAPGWRLDVYGDGPDREASQRLARRLAVDGRVRFLRRRPRHEVLQALADADALLFPSLHDSAPWAVAESVTAGTPVVCLDRAGPPELARVPHGGRAVAADRHAPEALAAALDDLPALRPVDWWLTSRLPEQIEGFYAQALGRHLDPERTS